MRNGGKVRTEEQSGDALVYIHTQNGRREGIKVFFLGM